MKIRFEVNYPAEYFDIKLDKKITNAIKGIGATWTGQGCDVAGNNRKRDIQFEIEYEKEVEVEKIAKKQWKEILEQLKKGRSTSMKPSID